MIREYLSEDAARAAALLLLRERGETGGGPRDLTAAEARRYAGDRAAYFREVLGMVVSAQQEQMLAEADQHPWVIIHSGNNIGKTFFAAATGVWWIHAVGSVPGDDGRPRGSKLLLPGPDHGTILSTIYTEMLAAAERAEARGFRVPGFRSDRSVNWKIRSDWKVEAFSPKREVKKKQSHGASGRHSEHLMALVEEGSGVAEALAVAVEGMCSGSDRHGNRNRILVMLNPTEPSGPYYDRRNRQGWRTLALSALDHPNVRERRAVVPGAISHQRIDDRVASECRDMGPAATVRPDILHQDFVYALPAPSQADGLGPRQDGIPGHPGAEPHVFRPTPIIIGQVLGQWPATSQHGLFDPAAIDRAMARWRETSAPDRDPDGLGLDIAQGGEDDTCAAPRWGEDGPELLRAWHEAETRCDDELKAKLRGDRRMRIGEVEHAPFSRSGVFTTEWAILRGWKDVPWIVDAGFGLQVIDPARDIYGMLVEGVSFGANPPERVPGEVICEDNVTAMYVRLSMLLDRDLIDLPPSSRLRDDLLVHKLTPVRKSIREAADGPLVKRDGWKLISKDEMRKLLGRSPDESDAVALACWPAPVKVDRYAPTEAFFFAWGR